MTNDFFVKNLWRQRFPWCKDSRVGCAVLKHHELNLPLYPAAVLTNTTLYKCVQRQDATFCHSHSTKLRASQEVVDGRVWRRPQSNVRVELNLWPLSGNFYCSHLPLSAAKGSIWLTLHLTLAAVYNLLSLPFVKETDLEIFIFFTKNNIVRNLHYFQNEMYINLFDICLSFCLLHTL